MKKRLVLMAVPMVLLVSGALTARWYEQAQLQVQLKQMQAAATKDFADPESARFRNLSLATDEPGLWDRLAGFGTYKTARPLMERLRNVLAHDPESLHLCGEVNAKNRLGAYVGYRSFEVIGHASPFVQVDSELLQLAAEVCAKQENVILKPETA